MYCFANIGVPKNTGNPFYRENVQVPPGSGFVPNPLGFNFIDYGLGDFLYPQQGLPIANMGPGATARVIFLAINGLFLTPTNRNVDLRPVPGFREGVHA